MDSVHTTDFRYLAARGHKGTPEFCMPIKVTKMQKTVIHHTQHARKGTLNLDERNWKGKCFKILLFFQTLPAHLTAAKHPSCAFARPGFTVQNTHLDLTTEVTIISTSSLAPIFVH